MRTVQVTPRDARFLGLLGEYGILDFALAHSLAFADVSAERCRQILSRLVGARLIRAIRLQVWYAGPSADGRYRGGRVPTLFVLGERGAETVRQWNGVWPRRVCRSDPTPATFFHRLHIVRARVSFDSAARASGLTAPQWVMEQDTRSDVPKNLSPNRRRWLYHEFKTDNGTITCQPDAAMRLALPHPTLGSTTLAAFFEIDLSREGHAQIRKKIPGYTALLARPALPYWPDLQQASFRVLWITLTPERLRELAGAVKGYPIADRFRFTTLDQCTDRVITDPVWQDISATPMAFLNRGRTD